MRFSEIEYKLTKHVCLSTSVRYASMLWGCTMKTIINRLHNYEVVNDVPRSQIYR